MVVPILSGDVDVSMLKEAVELINGRFETEVPLSCRSALIFLWSIFWSIFVRYLYKEKQSLLIFTLSVYYPSGR